MSDDGKGTPKKQWKAFNVSYEFVVGAGVGCCTYALTNQQVAALLSMTEYLRWPTRWVKSAGSVSRDFTNDFTDELERALMNGCCPDNIPVQYRYNEDGELERSLDGGASWTPAPQYDVRNNSTEFPPIAGEDGDDKKCQAAGAMVVALELQITDQLTDDMSSITLAELIESWVTTYHETSNPFLTILTVAVNQIFALGIALLRAAITDGVYDTLRCIFYCNMLDDGSFDNAGWMQVKIDIGEQVGGIAGLFFGRLVELLGYGGLTNMARSGYSSDEDCDCECNQTCANNWSVYPNTPNYFGTITEVGEGYIVVETDVMNTNGLYYQYLITENIDQCCYMTSFEVISGTLSGGLAWGVCGSAIGSLNTGIFFEGCVNQLQPSSNVPFTIKYYFSDCP